MTFAEFQSALGEMKLPEIHNWVLKLNGLTADPGKWHNQWLDAEGDDCFELLISSSDLNSEAPPRSLSVAYKRFLLTIRVKRISDEHTTVEEALSGIAKYHNSLLEASAER